MGAIVSAYTEVEFAACLLECGPHVETRELNDHIDPFNAYYNRVFDWYRRHCSNKPNSIIATEWVKFWHKYQEWVEP